MIQALIAAFAAQGVEVVWRGEPPANPEDITAEYLSEDIDGLPRMRPVDAVLDLVQLRADYAAGVAKVLVPRAVTPRQARLALLAAGHLPAVAAALDAIPDPDGAAARIEWEYASAIERHSPLVAALSAQLGLSEAEVDALFVAAKGL